MDYKPAIDPKELAALARCPKCRGVMMSCIERFMDDTDRADIERYRATGFLVSSVEVARMGTASECVCKAPVSAIPSSNSLAQDRIPKPTLSIKRKLPGTG